MRRPRRALDAGAAPFYRWFPDGALNTCYNALDRHVVAGRGEQPALVYDSPVDRRAAHVHLRAAARAGRPVRRRAARARGRRRRPRGDLHADGARGRRSRCSPAPGSAPCTRWCSAGSPRPSWRCGSTTPARRWSLSASCGIEPSRVVEYKPLLDEALELAEHAPGALRDPAAPAGRPPSSTERDLDWDAGDAAGPIDPAEVRAGGRHRPALRALHLRHHRPAQGHRARQRRARGRAALVDAGHLRHRRRARCVGPPATSAGSSGTPTSSTRRCSPGATTVLYEGKPVGTPDAGAFWRVIAEHGVKALFTAPTAFRAIKKEDPDGEHAAPARRLVAAHAVPGRRAARPGHLRSGRASRLGVPVVDHWWQTETGWPIVRQPARAGAAADQAGLAVACRCPATTCRCWTTGGQPAAGRHRGRDLHPAAAAAGHPADAVARRRAVRRVVPVRLRRLLPDRRRRLRRRGRLRLRDGPHRRRDQRGRAPAVDRVDGGGAGRAPGGRGVRRDRRGRRAEGPGAARLGGAQGRRATPTRPTLAGELVAAVRERDRRRWRRCAGSTWSPALPKTRSGKILRRTMREIADGADPAVPSTIEDASVLDTLRPTLRG